MESNLRSPVEQLAALASKAVLNRTKLAADSRNATFVCGGSVTSSQPILIYSRGHTAGTGIPLKVLCHFLNRLQKELLLRSCISGRTPLHVHQALECINPGNRIRRVQTFIEMPTDGADKCRLEGFMAACSPAAFDETTPGIPAGELIRVRSPSYRLRGSFMSFPRLALS